MPRPSHTNTCSLPLMPRPSHTNTCSPRSPSCFEVSEDEGASMEQSIEDIKCVQEEQKSLLQELLLQNRVALLQTEAFLKPMQECLQSMQSQLQELSRARLVTGCSQTFVTDMDAHDPGSAICASKSYSNLFVPGAEDKLSKQHQISASVPSEPSAQENESCDKVDEESDAAAFDVLEQRKIKKELQFGARYFTEYERSIEDKLVQQIEAFFHSWASIEVPQYDSHVYKIVNSNTFSTICMIAICLNSVLVAAIADWQIQHIGKEAPQALDFLQMSFTIFFLAELILRLAAFRMYFFLTDDMLWNVFDLLLVTISMVDFIFKHFVGSRAGSNISFMRMLRLLKMARILRSLRTIQFFKALSVMLASLKKAFLSLFWGLVLLCFVLYTFALIYVQALVDYFDSANGEHIDADILEITSTRFDTLLNAIVSLYMSVTGGTDWGAFYDTMSKLGPIYGFFFLIYTFFFFFGLLNILTGLVVEKAMAEGEPDRSDQILHQRRALAQSRHELTQICHSIDTDNSGRISYEEFSKWIDHSVMRHLMQSLGLDVRDVELFFSAVGAKHGDSSGFNHGEVAIGKFVEGCLHMKGSATAIDMQKQLYEMDLLCHKFQRFDAEVSRRLSRIEKVMAHSQTSLDDNTVVHI